MNHDLPDIPLTQGLIQFGIWTTAIVLSMIVVGVAFILWSSYSDLSPEQKEELDIRHRENVDISAVADAARLPPGGDWSLFLLAGIPMVIGGTVAIAKILISWPRDITRTIVGSAMILIVGSLFFWLKVKRLITYAAVEISFALVFAIYTMAFDLKNSITQLQALKIGSSIYLLIRGFDNLKKGIEEKRKKASTATGDLQSQTDESQQTLCD